MNKPNENIAPTSPALRAAWDKYLVTLDEARQVLEASPQYQNSPQHRGMAYRQLIEVQAMGYNFCVAPRTRHPRVYRNTCWQTEHYCIGGNGADFDYHTVFLDGKQTYKFTGRMNDSRMMLAQLNSATPGVEGARCVANYDFSDFKQGADGSFEVILSAQKQEGNWIQLVDSDLQWMLIRPTAESWDEVPAELRIERLGDLSAMDTDAEEYSEAAVARRLGFMTDFVRYLIKEWAVGFVGIVMAKSQGQTNKFITFSAQDAKEEGSPSAEYLQCVFEVEDDEALILEFDEEPEGPYWSLQLYDMWQHTIGFRTRQTMLNGKQMSKDSDGKVRVVLCRRDPGVNNWLDNAGYTKGEVTWRNYKAVKIVGHRIHRVKFAELDKQLPTNTKRISKEERKLELQRRTDAYYRRHGE